MYVVASAAERQPLWRQPCELGDHLAKALSRQGQVRDRIEVVRVNSQLRDERVRFESVEQR